MQNTLATFYEKHETRIRSLTLCGLSAVLYSLVSPRLHWYPLAWVMLVPFIEALHDKGPRQGFYTGWCFGTLIHLFCFHWVIGTIQRYSNLSLPLSLVAWILFALYSGLAFGAMSLVDCTIRRFFRLPFLVTLPLCYTAMEYLFPFIFAWHLGAGLYQVLPFIQIADIFGVYGITALVVIVNAGIWEFISFLSGRRTFPWAPVSFAFACVMLTVLYGFWRMEAVDRQRVQSPPYPVGVVQPNLRVGERQSPMLSSDIWHRYQQLSGEVIREGAELVVWPESAVHFAYDPESGQGSLSGVLRHLVTSLGKPVLFGTWSKGQRGPRNTAFLLSPAGELAGKYDKVRLLAFGEFLPFASLVPAAKDWIQGVGDFEPGDRLDPLCWRETCFGVLICYEAILDGLSRELVQEGAKFLINITNDVWFGDTRCPEQHLMLASFRAVENRVWLVRAANTGISAFVDPAGRILQRTPLFQQASRFTTIELLSIPSIYKSWGDWFPISCSIAAGVSLLLSLALKRRRSLP